MLVAEKKRKSIFREKNGIMLKEPAGIPIVELVGYKGHYRHQDHCSGYQRYQQSFYSFGNVLFIAAFFERVFRAYPREQKKKRHEVWAQKYNKTAYYPAAAKKT